MEEGDAGLFSDTTEGTDGQDLGLYNDFGTKISLDIFRNASSIWAT
jgi:hypothetical protein